MLGNTFKIVLKKRKVKDLPKINKFEIKNLMSQKKYCTTQMNTQQKT